MSQANADYTLPGPIAQKLRSVRRRMNAVGLAAAAVGAFAVLLAAMLLSMLVDYLATLYDSAWRSALTYAAMGLALATLTGWVVLAWRRSRRTVDVAREVDRRVPHLEERWSTVAHFADSQATGDGAVHPAMFRQVADEAVRGETCVDPGAVVSLGGVVKAFLVLNAVTLVLVLAAVADWRQTSVLLRRFWAPSANISITGFQAEPGDAVVGRGEPLLISAALTGPPIGEATLLLHSDAEGDDRITLIPRGEADLSVSHRFRSVEESFAYRLRGGDGQTEWFDVTVADRPVLKGVRIEVTPPEYRKEPAQRLDKMPRRLAAVEGSELTLALRPAAPLGSLVLETGDGEALELPLDDDGWYRWRTELANDLTLTPLLTEPHGLAMRRPPTTRLHVYPDRPPVVRVISPDDHIAVTPDDKIEIDFVAEDDNGIGAAELVVLQDPLDGESAPIVLETIPIDLGDAIGAKQVRGTIELDLSDYPLVDGSSLSYAIRVVEQRSPGAMNEAVAGGDSGEPRDLPDAGKKPEPAAVADASIDSSESEIPGDSADVQGQGDDAIAETRVALANKPAEGEQSGASGSESATPPHSSLARDGEPAENGQADLTKETPAAAGENAIAEGLAKLGVPIGAEATSGQNKPAPSSAADSNSTPQSAEQPDNAPVAQQQPDETSLADAPAGENETPPAAGDAPANRTAESDQRSVIAATPGDLAEGDSGDQPPAGSMASSSEASPTDDEPTGSANEGQNESSPNQRSLADAESNPSDNPSSPDGQPSSATNSSRSSQMASEQSGNNSGERQPGDDMTRRMLDSGAQSASSNSMRLEVDQYAGSFEGQQRTKLEIAVAPELAAIEKHLVAAQKLSRAALDDLSAGKGWQARRHRDIGAAVQSLKQAEEVSRKLRGRTHETPYAFIGLQIADISAANITPARDYFWRSLRAEGEERTEKIRQGWQQVGQALDRIAALSRRFEVTRREYALADAAEKIEKMYRVFVEDSFARPAGEGGDGGSPFQRKMVEFDLDEEYLARLKEVLEMQRELRAELARILAEDPRLLRRFMNNFREGQLNLRNQLTELGERQRQLTKEVGYWAAADEAERGAAITVVTRRRLEESMGIATGVGQLVDCFEAWMPLDAKKDELGDALDDANALAADARELAFVAQRIGSKRFEKEQLGELVERSSSVYERLRAFEVTLRGLCGDESLAGDIDFIINRLADTRGLIADVSSWNRRVEALAKGAFHQAAEIEQYELATATDELAGKLGDVESQIAGLLQSSSGTLPMAIATPARELLKTLDQEATPNQMAAAVAIAQRGWPRAAERQQAATGALAKAEDLFDQLIQAAIDELDKLPVQDPIAQLLDDPTLDEILAELERESRLEEALGIPQRRSNLQIVSDWVRPDSGGGMGSGMSMAARQSQAQQKRLSQAARRTQDEAKRRIKQNRQVVRQAPPKPAREDFEESGWNKLVSELDDDLLQGREKLPPERYRAAIEQYRTLMNRIASEKEQP